MFNSSKKTSNTYNTYDQRKTNQQDGFINIGENTAIEGPINISNGVVESNTEMRKTAEAAFNYGDHALELGSQAIEANKSVVGDALKQGFAFGNTAIESNGEVLQKSIDSNKQLLQQSMTNAASSTAAIKDLAQSLASKGASDVTQQSIKTVYAVVAVVIVLVLGAVIVFAKGK